MDAAASTLPVIVGIDGSKAAVRAALWAADEAVSRDVPIRLLHVVDADEDIDDAFVNAQHVLHEAWAGLEATGKSVKIESDVVRGNPAEVLVESSPAAALVCLGWKGVEEKPERRGLTAAEVARSALCPVAIVHRRHTRRPLEPGRWIVAVLDGAPGAPAILQTAMEEAQLRDAPVLVLTPWSTTTRSSAEDEDGLRARLDRYRDESEPDADVQICAIPMPDHVLNLLNQSAQIDQLVIVGRSDSGLVEQLIGPEAQAILRKTNCSLLIEPERSR
jgi:nucleotide-binding universal stress UspA family protein